MRVCCLAFVLVTMLHAPAFAHEASDGALPLSGYDALSTVLLALTGAAYVVGAARLWRRAGMGRGVHLWQALCFLAGWISLAIAMFSPLHRMADHLLTAHMIEHEILMALAAPLIAISRPVGAMLWALPIGGRRIAGGIVQGNGFRTLWLIVSAPVVATTLHALAIWGWHLPLAFDAALADERLHWLQHISFFGTGLLFWWALIGRNSVLRHGQAIGHLFITSTHMSVLGALLALSSTSWFAADGAALREFGLSAVEDQQVAGLVMWVPAGLIYAFAAVAVAGIWIRASAGAAPRHV